MNGTPAVSSPKGKIFVLGIQRSGTTLAANLLAAHPQIAGVTAARHHGIHESIFFSHFAQIFGDWSDPQIRQKAILAFVESDYVKISKIKPCDILKYNQTSPGRFFADFMDEFANSRNCYAWVEKSPHHTNMGPWIAEMLPEATFLLVFRNTADLALSRIYAYGRIPGSAVKRLVDVVRATVSNSYHQKCMRKFQKHHPKAFAVSFKELTTDPDVALAPLLDSLSLAPLAGTRPEFGKNSSFSNAKPTLNLIERAVLICVNASLHLLPFFLVDKIRKYKQARVQLAFPSWVWPQDITGAKRKEIDPGGSK